MWLPPLVPAGGSRLWFPLVVPAYPLAPVAMSRLPTLYEGFRRQVLFDTLADIQRLEPAADKGRFIQICRAQLPEELLRDPILDDASVAERTEHGWISTLQLDSRFGVPGYELSGWGLPPLVSSSESDCDC